VEAAGAVWVVGSGWWRWAEPLLREARLSLRAVGGSFWKVEEKQAKLIHGEPVVGRSTGSSLFPVL